MLTPITPILLQDIERKAREATPGKWRAGKWINPQSVGLDFQVFCDELEVTPCPSVTLEVDAAFIAKADPPTVLALCGALRRVVGNLNKIAKCLAQERISACEEATANAIAEIGRVVQIE